ncbi:uncharacterized protein N7473_001864 [Penicillium subrubescens]|uniref:uncharacterized protein n=1 Tax=Penicillium subrubescens TaxID=1316194 RepID=UPI0025457E83|nr:uncharacterized protein N7473_001864 [Penicillium subrubescens]KAJ5904948.1 hypothetical protein N7473_001864 [Penicillium subrubescens]
MPKITRRHRRRELPGGKCVKRMSRPEQGMTFVSDISARPRAFKTGNHKKCSEVSSVPCKKNPCPMYSTHYILSSGHQRGWVPFQAQHIILQSIQRHLEYHAFWYVERYFLPESVQNGWTCPEALELHKLFQFLNRHRRASTANPSGPAVSDIQGWRDSISAIRHAAVHHLAQDRQSLLRMTRAAISFVQLSGVLGNTCGSRFQGHLDGLSFHGDRQISGPAE